MARHHLESVLHLAPEVASRVSLLDPAGADVADPVGGDKDMYRAWRGTSSRRWPRG